MLALTSGFNARIIPQISSTFVYQYQSSTVFFNQPVNVFAKQLLAWSAIAMLFLQPLGLNGRDCGCRSGKLLDAAPAGCCSAKAADKSCCGSVNTMCCSANDKQSSVPCKCGDQCRCLVNEPGNPLPAVPVNESRNEQPQTLALTISFVRMIVSGTECKFGFRTFSVYRPALTAQQTCALLSRFIV